jgi:DNA-binding transcriptional LysR family regulator
MVAVLPPHHPLAERTILTWRALTTHPFIAFSPDSSIRRLTDLAFAHCGIEPNNVIETRNVATAAGMIAAGLGVSAVPELVLPLLSFANLTVRPLTTPAITRKLAVLTRSDVTRSPAATGFHHELLRDRDYHT